MALDETLAKQAQAEAEVEEEQDPEMEQLTDEEEDDLAIMVMLSENMIDDAGIDVIDQALKSSNDPGTVIGDFLMQLVAQMSEQLPQDFNLSPRVFLVEGGWVEQISDYLQEQYNVPKDVMDRAEMYIATQSQSMANGAVAQQAQAAPAPAGAPPQAGLEGMVGGMV